MKHFTIDTDNNITVHSSKKAARETGAAAFSTEEQFADVIGPDNKRLVEIFNSLPGVKPVAKFANRKIATERIWKAIQSLGEASAPTAQPQEPAAEQPEPTEETTQADVSQTPATAEADHALPEQASEPAQATPEAPETLASAEPVAAGDAPAADVAPAASEASTKAVRAKKAPKVPKVAKAPQSESGPREGSKTAQVVAMLKREGGATLAEIMTTMGWQKHTVRGFMAGTMKKAGFTVESFKPEGGERTYRINK
jgi:hypothetical protein